MSDPGPKSAATAALFLQGVDGLPVLDAARLERLAEIVDGCERLARPRTPGKEELAERVHAALVSFHGSCEHAPSRAVPASEAPLDARRAAYTAGACLPLLARMTGEAHLDSAGSKVMRRYRPDWRGASLDLERLAASLRLAGEQSEVDEYVVEASERLRSIHNVLEAVREEAGLAPGAVPEDAKVLELFRKVYPPCRLEPGEVKLYWTRCSAHFAVFVEKTRGKAYSEFWDSVSGFRFPYYDHFPMFGFLSSSAADYPWVTRISERSGEPVAVTRRILDSSLMALKGETLELYLLHDVWGHRWEGIFTRWKPFYDQLKIQDEALVVTESYADGARAVHLESLLSTRVDSGTPVFGFEEEALGRWLAREAEERLALAFTQILAELAADLVEDKYNATRPAGAPHLGSTSRLPGRATRIDLSLEDFRRIWLGITSPFRKVRKKGAVLRKSIYDTQRPKLAGRASGEAVWEASGAVAEKLVDAIESFAQRRLVAEVGPAGGLYALGAANLLELHEVVDRLCRLEDRSDGRLCDGFRDLLCLFVAQEFERSPATNFWTLDEVLTRHFLPLAEAVKGAARGGTAA